MANRKMMLSEEGKTILDTIVDALEIDRPTAIKIALAKGIATSKGPDNEEYSGGKNKWTIPDAIIKDKEYLLFKHLIINEIDEQLSDEEVQKYMLHYIENGLRKLEEIHQHKTSMEDFRLSIL